MFYQERLMNYFRQRDRGWVLSLLALVFLIYLPFLGSPLVFDDVGFLYGSALGSSPAKYYADAPFRFDLRWLPYTTLGWTWRLVGDMPHLYRLANILLHAGNVILLFFLLRQLVAAALPDTEKSSITKGAWFGALVFACHPVAVYAVGYVVQRSILMATFFALIMQMAYLRGLIGGQKHWLVLAVAAYALAGFSREHSVMMPAVLLAMTILLRDKIQLGRPALWLTFAASAAVALILTLTSKGIIGSHFLGPVSEPMGEHALGQLKLGVSSLQLHVLSALTQAGLFFKYLLLWALPNPAWMSVDMRETFVVSLSAWQGWAGAVAFIAYGLLGLRLLLRRGMSGLIGLALLYPWLLFVVEFSSMRMQEIFVLYRSYLWMPGSMLFFVLLLIKRPGNRTLLALSAFVLLLTAFSLNRLWVFADNYRLWNDAALLLKSEQVQGADRILYNRGISVSASKKPGGAIADLESSIALSPQLAPLHFALGVEYFNASRYQEALAEFDSAITLDPENAKAYYGKGMTLKRLHKDGPAIDQMKKSCELKHVPACMIVEMAQFRK